MKTDIIPHKMKLLNVACIDAIVPKLLPIEKKRKLVPHGSYNGFIDVDGSATCTDCKIEKPNDEFTFYKNRVNPQTRLCLYVNKKCSDCRKLYTIHKKESTENVKKLKIARPVPTVQNPYKCDCCNKDIFTTRTIQLDHCHKSGLFRGWLCKECNISMGNLGDDINGIMRVIKYLNKTEKICTNDLNIMLNEVLSENKDDDKEGKQIDE
jgi:Recombination endonuclease VII